MLDTALNRRTLLGVLAGSCTALPAVTALAAGLVNPYDVAALRARKGAPGRGNSSCPALTVLERDLVVPDFYSDPPVYSVVDPVRVAAREAVLKPLVAVERGVTSLADRWAVSPSADCSQIACATGALARLAEAGSTLGKTNMQGSFERKWMFGALALAHLKMATAPEYGPATQERVRGWFTRFLPELREVYDRTPGRGPAPAMQRNNHATWAGLCAMALSLAVDDEAGWRWGLSRITMTLEQVDPEGFLPLELMRGQKALHYHGFTMAPLALAGFLARANGIDIAGDRSGPFHRLARRTLAGYADPSAFEARAGKTQTPFAKTHDMAWVEIYAGEYGEPAALAVLDGRRPQVQPWLGGDLTLWHARDR